jgi:oligopeptide transport system substrate-binding protein
MAFTALVAACNEEESTGSERTPQARQEISMWLSGEPQTIDPNRAAFDVEVSVVRQLFRGLLWFDEKLSVAPMAAREVPSVDNGSISRDGLTYTFKLRDDLKWSDGQPVTAADFEYSFKRLLDPAIAADYATLYYDVKGAQEYNSSKDAAPEVTERLRSEVGVKATDSKTLVFTLKNVRPTFLQLMALWPTSPVRQDIIQKHGDTWTDPANIVGNGPFVLTEWAHQDHLTLAPNPHWWGTEKPKLDKVVFKIIEDRAQAYNAYLAGELDVVAIPPEQMEAIKGNAELSKQRVVHTELATFAHQFNNAQAPFDNPKVRQAFSLSFDRDALVNVVYKGVDAVAYSWLPPGMPGHDASLGQQWKFDADKAKRLLSEAGFPDGRGLPKITFTYANTGTNPLVAQFTQEQFKRNLGVEIELEPLEPRAFQQRIANEEFQLSLLGFLADYPDAENWLPDFWSCKKYEGDKCTQFAGNNHANYANPQFDALVEQAARELDPKKRLELYTKAHKVLTDDAAVIFTRYRARNLLVKSHVKDLTRTAMDGAIVGDFFLEKVSVTKS